MPDLVIDLALAAIPLAVGLAISWRVIWPSWKVPGKILFYFGFVTLLSLTIGHWSVLVGWLHQGVGIAAHLYFCRKHGFTWYAVEDPARYIELSQEAVGYTPGDEA